MTPAQKRALAAVTEHGSARAAAKALGVHHDSISRALRRAEKAAPVPGIVVGLDLRTPFPMPPVSPIADTPPDVSDRAEVKDLRAKLAAAEKVIAAFGAHKPPPVPVMRKGKAAKHIARLIVPDSHGEHIDPAALGALLGDLEQIEIGEIVYLGDHLDAGGTFSAHQRNYTHEMTESYAADVSAANDMLDQIQRRAPNARKRYLEGNHEQHVERWAARNFESFADAKLMVEKMGPQGVLALKQREIEYFKASEMYDGLSVPGTIRLGKCYFTHGMSHSKHADAAHLQRVGANIVFGHVHRSMSVGERTVECEAMGAWCPGTLAKLQPLYRHTTPTSWQHGYAVQFVNMSTGTFAHFQVPIYKGESYLKNVIDAVKGIA